MGFNCGIVGLPNVGKSTLFNALTQTSAAEAANYPFCTIEPNIGCIGVPNDRLEVLAKIAKSQKIIPTQVEFVDIAGLVKGASKGEGLGNQFLGHIRSTDAIIHLLRCFEDKDIAHINGEIDPIRDFSTVETELMLSDMESLEKRIERLSKKNNNLSKEAKEQFELMKEALLLLQKGEPLRSKENKSKFSSLDLLSDKPVLVVCNVSEKDAINGNEFTDTVIKYMFNQGIEIVIISAAFEAELAALTSQQEKADFLESIGLKESGLSKVIRAGYKLLNLETFFTAGPQETKAWSIIKGTKAPDAAAVIHTDFKRGFICAETIHYEDYIAFNGEQGAKAAGKLRIEGKDYVVCDSDVMLFRFNV
ncbi:MAG: redox-regulated ATPase YchF [Holosporales bacterium]|jgi:GTP-binding protein YchF|nr:redox-regulated ATPase YchF [Holosporales bacterium]